jgi:valine dehydrogenase (NAD+)
MTFIAQEPDHEQVVVRQDPETGLRFVVAVHSTALGPALGGLRLRAYDGGLPEAVADALALARTMTLKAAASGLPLGGGKAVMIDDGADADVRAARMVAAAREVDRLGGAYVTAEDIGTHTADMDLIARHTRFVVGRSADGGGRGDPSPVTAETVYRALRRGLEAATGSDAVDGRRVAVVGLGKVGGRLAERLATEGAHVIAYDLDSTRTERFAAEHGGVRSPSLVALLATEADVLAPCAAGGLIGEALAGELRCKVVAGAANNPLTGPVTARRLAARGILAVPDFLANCGGLIHVAGEWYGWAPDEDEVRIAAAMERLDEALADAERECITPCEAAERAALRRVAATPTAELAVA